MGIGGLSRLGDIVMEARKEDLELFERLARGYVEQRGDYEFHANGVQSAEQLKQIHIQRIIEEFQEKIPAILLQVIETLKVKTVHNGSKELIHSFMEKIDPQAIVQSYKQNVSRLSPDEKLYKFYNITESEFKAALAEGVELTNEKRYRESQNLYYLLTLFDPRCFEGWIGLAMATFLMGEADEKPHLECFEEALYAFWRAHELESCNTAPVIGMIESLICLRRYQEAKKILHEFADKKLDTRTEQLLNLLNDEVKDKL